MLEYRKGLEYIMKSLLLVFQRFKIFILLISLINCGDLPEERSQYDFTDGKAVLDISGSDDYPFGTQLVGSTTTRSILVIFKGRGKATSVTVNASLDHPFAFTGEYYPGERGDCGEEIISSCVIQIEFKPTEVGYFTTELIIDYHDGKSAAQARKVLTGSGI